MEPASRLLLDNAITDREAFAMVVKHTESMVFSLAFRFFRNRSQAEDIAQESYIELFRNLHKLESDKHLENWLRMTVTRKCIDFTRRKKNRMLQDLESVPEQSFDPMMRDPFLVETLQENVALLPERMRMVIILRFQEDLKLSEIAETMNVPVNTAKTLLRRALIRLKPKVEHIKTEICYAPAGR